MAMVPRGAGRKGREEEHAGRREPRAHVRVASSEAGGIAEREGLGRLLEGGSRQRRKSQLRTGPRHEMPKYSVVPMQSRRESTETRKYRKKGVADQIKTRRSFRNSN